MSPPDSTVLLAHIISQTRRNIEFLISQHVISQVDASALLHKLSDSNVIVQARALWDYQGLEANDLSFKSGDIIEILTETNTDWWTGRLNNRQGLFPSNYVHKINNVSKSQTYDLPVVPFGPSQAAPYQPVAGYQGPPPPPPGPPQVTYNLYTTPATPVQPQRPQSPQKGKLGGNLGSTLAHSAVGGVGFGAGSAVGSGIINSIF